MSTKNLSRGDRRVVAAAFASADRTLAQLDDLAPQPDSALAAALASLRRAAPDDADAYDTVAAIVAEAVRRHTGLTLRPNQLATASLLAESRIVELATGEGKTLAALPAAVWWSLAGNGVHVVTANSYLARRDAELAAAVLAPLGVTVGLVHADDQPRDEARAAHHCDLTYGTATAFGFDFLRDNLVTDLAQRVTRPRHAALVDEVDQVLIDEAVTPLVISGQAPDTSALVARCGDAADALTPGEHVDVDLDQRTVALTDEGATRASELLGVDVTSLAAVQEAAALRQALVARHLMRRDNEYVVRDGGVHIVDRYTGRTGVGRRWSDGLHQAIEYKEGLPLQPDTHTIASITLQDYFANYPLLAGMSGTALSARRELWGVYGLDTVAVPTHHPSARVDYDDAVYATVADKHAAVVQLVAEAHAVGRPVLVGAPTIAEAETLSGLLDAADVPHTVLSAKHHEREAAIIAQAGRLGSVVVATPMAGRGVDIKLGGEPVEDGAVDGSVTGDEAAQVRALGGLLVVGAARTASRRTDDQLRGRAGRQGDPGETRFVVSFADELLAPHVGNRAKRLAAGIDGPVWGRHISRALERAQGTIEDLTADQRRVTYERDEVRRYQRNSVWAARDRILGADLDDLDAVSAEAVGTVAGRLAAAVATDADPDDAAQRLGRTMAERWAAPLTGDELADLDVADTVAAAFARQLAANLAEVRGDPVAYTTVVRQLLLGSIDEQWLAHNDRLAALEDGIGLRGLVGTDPEAEWRREASELFGEMLVDVAARQLEWLCRAHIGYTPPAAPDSPDSADSADSPDNPTSSGRAAPTDVAGEDGGSAGGGEGR